MTVEQENAIDKFFSVYLKEAVEKFNNENPPYMGVLGSVKLGDSDARDYSFIILDRNLPKIEGKFPNQRILEMNTAGITHSSKWDK